MASNPNPVPDADTWMTKQSAADKHPAQAMIGPSIVIKGDLIGEEDILVQGRVEGTIHLNNHSLTVGGDGIVNANIHAKNVTVKGQLQGDVQCEELITVKKTGRCKGSLLAHRVSIEDGAKFKGSIDMSGEATDPHASAGKVGQRAKSRSRNTEELAETD